MQILVDSRFCYYKQCYEHFYTCLLLFVRFSDKVYEAQLNLHFRSNLKVIHCLSYNLTGQPLFMFSKFGNSLYILQQSRI